MRFLKKETRLNYQLINFKYHLKIAPSISCDLQACLDWVNRKHAASKATQRLQYPT